MVRFDKQLGSFEFIFESGDFFEVGDLKKIIFYIYTSQGTEFRIDVSDSGIHFPGIG